MDDDDYLGDMGDDLDYEKLLEDEEELEKEAEVTQTHALDGQAETKKRDPIIL